MNEQDEGRDDNKLEERTKLKDLKINESGSSRVGQLPFVKCRFMMHVGQFTLLLLVQCFFIINLWVIEKYLK